MQNYLLLEMELQYVRPHEIEKRLELARHLRNAGGGQPGLRGRMLLLVSDLLISIGQGLKGRQAPLAAGAVASPACDCIPSGS